MKLTQITMLAIASWVLLPETGSAAVYTVPATSDIYSAGRASPIAPSGDPGTLPVLAASSPWQGPAIQFQGVTGIVSSYGTMFSIGPDGLVSTPSRINAYAGISGFLTDYVFPLVGVFLTAATPQDPAPPTLDFTSTGLGRSFLSLSPAIGQVFFIGDGMTAGGTTQTFNIPSGATRLYLGLPDAPNWQGDPGHYGDNTGSFSVGVNVVPEPGSMTLLLAGAVLLALRHNRGLGQRG